MRMSNRQHRRTKDDVVVCGEGYAWRRLLGVRRTPLASGQCSKLPAISALIRLDFRQGLCTLRVCGKKSYFSSQTEQAEVGKLVLWALAMQASDNCFSTHSHSQISGHQLVAHLSLIPHTPSPKNLQHSFALFSPLFLLPPTTLICIGEYLFPCAKISSLSTLPEGRIFDPNNDLVGL
jgi:hypothetical protein